MNSFTYVHWYADKRCCFSLYTNRYLNLIEMRQQNWSGDIVCIWHIKLKRL